MKYARGLRIDGGPWILRFAILGEVLKRFLGGELFLVGIMILADLFSSMWRFLAMDSSVADILVWVGAGAPSHVLEVLPIALLFGITFSLAELQTDGEFLAICGSGISVQSLSLPIVVFSILLGGFLYFGGDGFVVPAASLRDQVYAKMTGQKADAQAAVDITIMARGGRVVYRAQSLDTSGKRLIETDVVMRGSDGALSLRILAPRAEWRDGLWHFQNPRLFERLADGSWTERDQIEFSDSLLDETPSSFAFQRVKPAHMRTEELAEHAAALKDAGLPSAEAATEYYKRLAFLLTPLIVCGLSLSFSGFFRKNVLLMSLLFSLATATVYYVAQMLGSLSAKLGLVDPALAVWGVTAFFVLASAAGFLRART
ncbi:MAG: LptF/LptG family permease [Spirochaetes bacterium]|nr:LptF/LptG family permease [Spirochaetota bacterium]